MRIRVALFVLAAVPRLLYLAVARPAFEGYHLDVADNLRRHGTVGVDGVAMTAYDPFYPGFLAGAQALFGGSPVVAQALQAAVDATGAVLLFALADALTGRRRIALLAGGLYACYPLLIHHAVIVSDASLLSILLLAFACLAVRADTRGGAAGAGLCLGAAVLTRSMAAPLVALAASVWIARRRGTAAAVCTVAALALTVPWTVRNYAVGGTIWPGKGGANLFQGNSPYVAALLPDYNLDVLGPYVEALAAQQHPSFLDGRAETERDRAFTGMAWQNIRTAWLETLRMKLWNVAYFFWPRLVPSRVMTPDTQLVLQPDGGIRVEHSVRRPLLEELAYSATYVPVAIAALAGIWIRRRQLPQDAFLWCIVVTFVIVHAVFYPATRLRAPMEFVLLFYAAVAFDRALPDTARPA